MTARDMVLNEINSKMLNCNDLMAGFRSYITWQSSNFSRLPNDISSEFGENPKALLYSIQLQYYIDKIFLSATKIEIDIQNYLESIGYILGNVQSLSIMQLYSLKVRLGDLTDILVKLLKIFTERGTEFLLNYKDMISNLMLEQAEAKPEENC